MTYRERLLTHLAEYKRQSLGVSGPGVFRYKGRDVPRDHILPLADQWLNILEPNRDLVRRYLADHLDVGLHSYFHHLNSSQAFAFNLFIPFFEGGKEAANALLRAFGQDGPLLCWSLEAIPDSREFTNIDVEWVTARGSQTFCEVKLSELEFGKPRNDAAHRRKLEDTYVPTLAGHVEPWLLQPEAFFGAYQIFRNVFHLLRKPGSELVFLLPRANEILWRKLSGGLEGVLPETRRRICVSAVEDVIAHLSSDETCPAALRAYARELGAKYLVP